MRTDNRARNIVLIIALLAVVVATGAFLAPRVMGYLEIDGCLDSGGAWNHAAAKCSRQRR